MKPEEKKLILERLKAQYKHIPGGISSDVKDIAKYIVSKSTIDNKPVNNEQVHLILFVLQRDALTYVGLPVHHGVFEAWDKGPIIPEVYDMFQPRGTIRDICKNIGEIRCTPYIDAVVTEVQEMRSIMELERSVRHNKGAWYTTWFNNKGANKEIPLYLIRAKG